MSNEAYPIHHRDSVNLTEIVHYKGSNSAELDLGSVQPGDFMYATDTDTQYISEGADNWQAVQLQNHKVSLPAGSPGTADAGQVILTASNTLSEDDAIPQIATAGSHITSAGISNTTVTTKVAVVINGTTYYLLATTNGS